MAAFDYIGLLVTAQGLIADFGGTITLTRSYDKTLWIESYDPVTGTKTWEYIPTGATQSTEPDDAEYSADGVLVNIEEKFIDNSLVNVSDSELLVIGIPVPAEDDIFLVNGKSYKYVTHGVVNPAGTIMLYKVILRI